MARPVTRTELDPERIRPFLGDRSILASQLLDGARSSSYRVRVASGDEVVVRFSNPSFGARERRAMALAAPAVPVPEVLHIGDGWAVLRWIPGTRLAERPDAIQAAAHALARIGAVELANPGQLETDGGVRPWPFDGLAGFVAQRLEDEVVRGWLGQDLMDGVHDLMRAEATRIGELDAQSRLVHGDYNPRNILVDGDEVSGILDWEFAHSGSPFMDIGNLRRHLGPRFDPQIAAGLEEGGMEVPPDWRERAALVDLTAQLEFLGADIGDEEKQVCVSRVRDAVRS